MVRGKGGDERWNSKHKEQTRKGGTGKELKGRGSGPRGCQNPLGTVYNILLQAIPPCGKTHQEMYLYANMTIASRNVPLKEEACSELLQPTVQCMNILYVYTPASRHTMTNAFRECVQ